MSWRVYRGCIRGVHGVLRGHLNVTPIKLSLSLQSNKVTYQSAAIDPRGCGEYVRVDRYSMSEQ